MPGGHSVKTPLEGKVHECRVQQVVLVMTQGNLVAAKLLSQVEQLLAAIPGAKKAGRLGL